MNAVIQKTIFEKNCKCGNRIKVVVRKNSDPNSVEVECYNKPRTLYPAGYLIGSSTVECANCGKRFRTYHEAYAVEARTWKTPLKN